MQTVDHNTFGHLRFTFVVGYLVKVRRVVHVVDDNTDHKKEKKGKEKAGIAKR